MLMGAEYAGVLAAAEGVVAGVEADSGPVAARTVRAIKGQMIDRDKRPSAAANNLRGNMVLTADLKSVSNMVQ
jgi:hypothetical protein